MQGWPSEMQNCFLHLGRPTLHVGPPFCMSAERMKARMVFCISDHLFASRAANPACRPTSSAKTHYLRILGGLEAPKPP